MGYVVGALFSDEAATKNSLIIPAVLVGGRKNTQPANKKSRLK